MATPFAVMAANLLLWWQVLQMLCVQHGALHIFAAVVARQPLCRAASVAKLLLAQSSVTAQGAD